MGYSSYDTNSRTLRSESLGYKTKSANDIFEQNKKGECHDDMNPKNITVRECADSAAHPKSKPVIIGIDETGSMGKIPMQLVREGLPNMVGKLLDNGVKDSSILFLGIGDHESDSYPLQVGQFESGDAELDMWLTRLFLEGKGGGNGGRC